MNGRFVCEIPDGAVLVDCVTRIMTVDAAKRIKADVMARDGVKNVGIIQYVGKMSTADPGLQSSHVDAILAGGCGFFGVCFADQFDGANRAKMYADAGAMPGLTLGMDLESYKGSAAACMLSLNGCSLAIEGAGFLPLLYEGALQPLNAEQLGGLPETHRYWESLSRVAMPTYHGVPRGYSLVQHLGDPTDPKVDWRHVMRGGVNVDINTAQPDLLGRRITWMIAANEAPTLPSLPSDAA